MKSNFYRPTHSSFTSNSSSLLNSNGILSKSLLALEMNKPLFLVKDEDTYSSKKRYHRPSIPLSWNRQPDNIDNFYNKSQNPFVSTKPYRYTPKYPFEDKLKPSRLTTWEKDEYLSNSMSVYSNPEQNEASKSPSRFGAEGINQPYIKQSREDMNDRQKRIDMILKQNNEKVDRDFKKTKQLQRIPNEPSSPTFRRNEYDKTPFETEDDFRRKEEKYPTFSKHDNHEKKSCFDEQLRLRLNNRSYKSSQEGESRNSYIHRLESMDEYKPLPVPQPFMRPTQSKFVSQIEYKTASNPYELENHLRDSFKKEQKDNEIYNPYLVDQEIREKSKLKKMKNEIPRQIKVKNNIYELVPLE